MGVVEMKTRTVDRHDLIGFVPVRLHSDSPF